MKRLGLPAVLLLSLTPVFACNDDAPSDAAIERAKKGWSAQALTSLSPAEMGSLKKIEGLAKSLEGFKLESHQIRFRDGSIDVWLSQGLYDGRQIRMSVLLWIDADGSFSLSDQEDVHNPLYQEKIRRELGFWLKYASERR